MKDKSKPIDHSGSSFEEFLREEGVLEEAETMAHQARDRGATAPGDAAKAHYEASDGGAAPHQPFSA